MRWHSALRVNVRMYSCKGHLPSHVPHLPSPAPANQFFRVQPQTSQKHEHMHRLHKKPAHRTMAATHSPALHAAQAQGMGEVITTDRCTRTHTRGTYCTRANCMTYTRGPPCKCRFYTRSSG